MEFGPTLPTYWFADSNHGNAEGKCQQLWYLTVIAYDDDDDDDGDDDDDDGETILMSPFTPFPFAVYSYTRRLSSSHRAGE